MRFINNLSVVYGDSEGEMPPDAIPEFTQRGNDINKGFEGKYVWLVPTYTQDSAAAATSFQLIITGDKQSAFQDLALGAGGKYRYLIAEVNPSASNEVTEAALLRSVDKVEHHAIGWNMLTEDLNKDGGGTFLYVVLKTVHV